MRRNDNLAFLEKMSRGVRGTQPEETVVCWDSVKKIFVPKN